MRLIASLLLLFTVHLCCESSSIFHYGRAQVFDSSSSRSRKARSIPRRFEHRIWKRQDDLGYLEQCSILQFWDKQIGRVNVLAFFDSSWQFSHRQAAMLKVLRERFERTGFRNIQFFAVNAAPGEARYIDRAEVEAEEETWKQISPSEADGVPPVVATPEALVEALGPHIYFIQDNDELQIWPKLRAFRDQILVIDRCGRLTYQVIVPWSILHFPYVKAAILSTYKDEPCGHCEFQESPFDTTSSEKYKPSTSTEPPTESSPRSSGTFNDSSLPVEESSTVQTENYHSQITSEESSTIPPEPEGVTDNSFVDSSEESPSTLLTPETEGTNSPPTSQESSTPISETESPDADYVTEAQSTSIPRIDDDRGSSDASTSTEPLVLVTETESPLDVSTSASYDSTVFESDESDDYANFTGNEESHLGDDFNATTAYDFEDTTETESLTTSSYEATDAYDTEALSGEQQISHFQKTEIPTTTEISNTSLATNESRLREAEEIESIDSRDVLKSRSTNARSVSPNDGSENHLEDVETSSEASKALEGAGGSNESDYLLPIRIIMRAPHVDEYSDRTMKAHEYLVLKTGEPDYHDHLDEEDEPGRHVRKKPGALSRTFGKDESPGLYGEVADYWRNFGNEQQQLAESTQTSGADDEEEDEEVEVAEIAEQILEHDTGLADEKFAAPTPAAGGPREPAPDEEAELESERPYDADEEANEDVDVVDEEAKSKLIAHYSKLLPWLYYVLAK